MKKNSEKGKIKQKRNLFSVIALCIAILAILLALGHIFCVRHCGFGGMSDIGVLVSILGLFITFVVGFQIYNAVESKETLKEIGALKDVKKELDNFKADVYNMLGNDAYGNDFHELAICRYLKAIILALNSDNEKTLERGIGNISHVLNNEKKQFKFNSDNTHNVEGKDAIERASSLFKEIINNFSSKQYKSYIEKIKELQKTYEDKKKTHEEETYKSESSKAEDKTTPRQIKSPISENKV
jgi:hypothetical protein